MQFSKPYKLLQGKHYSRHGFKLFFSAKPLLFQALFSTNCLYQDPQNPGQINKLWGRSFGLHTKNPARIGWRGCNGTLELFAYLHQNGKIFYEKMGECELREWITFRIEKRKSTIEIEIKGKETRVYSFDDLPQWGYQLYPYFGGQLPAPHQMEIIVKILI